MIDCHGVTELGHRDDRHIGHGIDQLSDPGVDAGLRFDPGRWAGAGRGSGQVEKMRRFRLVEL